MSDARNTPSETTRRRMLAGSAALAAASSLPSQVRAQSTQAQSTPGLGSAAEFTARAKAFLAMLSPEQRKAATFAWNGREWRNWNYFGGFSLIKPGLRLEQMNAAQQDAAWHLLAAVFSPAGLTKARNVMLLQDVLAANGDSPSARSSKRFSFAFFGTPGDTGPWGFRLEGHHLSHSISVRDNRIVSVTPSSFSANPNRIGSGRHAGLTTLHAETQMARRLFADLDGKQAAAAKVSARPLGNIMSMSGAELSNTRKTGLAAADLRPAQQELLWRVIGAFAQDHLVPALAQAQASRLRAGDAQAIHFAWYGGNTPERAFGYRIIADAFVIELGSVDPAALHLHTIYHDLGNVLGRTG
ncbi:MAG: DUF3500 domain-containing protein [Beijerinckiaceae bacterium]